MMTFQFGDFDLTNYIQAKKYKTRPNARQDMNSYTDANGLTHRNAIPHTKTIISLSTIPMEKEEKMLFMQRIRENYLNELERDANCLYYDEEYDEVKEGHFYLDPNVEFTVNELGSYEEIKLTFTEY